MRFSPEWWSYWAGIWAIGFTTAAALLGLVVWYFSNVVSERNAERTAGLEIKVSEQQERAAKAEAELLSLQTAIAPRRLSIAQRETLTAALRGHPAKLKVIRLGDSEAKALANDIIAALTAAGWSVSVVEVGLLTPPRYGVSYAAGAPAGSELPTEIVALLVSLREAGIPASAAPEGFMGGTPLVVGLKPIQ